MTLWPASTSRRAMWAPILPRPMKPMSIEVLPRLFFPLPLWGGAGVGSCSDVQPSTLAHDLATPTLPSPTRGEGKFRAHLRGVFADCRHRTVVPRGAALLGRRRIGHRPARRADGDAAQMRMARQLGRRV